MRVPAGSAVAVAVPLHIVFVLVGFVLVRVVIFVGVVVFVLFFVRWCRRPVGILDAAGVVRQRQPGAIQRPRRSHGLVHREGMGAIRADAFRVGQPEHGTVGNARRVQRDVPERERRRGL